MAEYANSSELPRYLLDEQRRVEDIAKSLGLDFFPTIFQMVSYDQMNEIASYGGFPTRYPHWRFGMEYERTSKNAEYGLSKIYELVINNNPSIAYLLEGNSLTDQRMVMCHVYGHVDFFKNNFAFRSTDLDTTGPITDPIARDPHRLPDRRWVDRMANHGTVIRRLVESFGLSRVEELIDACLSLENLIDPWSPYLARRKEETVSEGNREIEIPRLRSKDYMDSFINPKEYIDAQKEKVQAERREQKGKFPSHPEQDVLLFLLENAPLERWERTILAVIRDEAYYFLPQMQTKIMNEGWASYWHSKLMTEHICDTSDLIDYAENNAAVMATSPQRINPYKLGVELYRHIEDRWNRGRFGKEWDECDDLGKKSSWDLKLNGGREKIFEVRSLYNDITFIDEFLTPEFAEEQGLFSFHWSNQKQSFEVKSREFKEVKEKLLTQLTNHGNPFIYVVDANHKNRGELLLEHQHKGVDLRKDYAELALKALHRLWKRPVCLKTIIEGKGTTFRVDGSNFETEKD